MGLCFCPSGNSPGGRTGALLAETLISLKCHKKLPLSFQESLWIKSGLGWPGWLLSHTPLLNPSHCSCAGGEDGM